MTHPEFHRSDRSDKMKHSISISTIKTPPSNNSRVTIDDTGAIT